MSRREQLWDADPRIEHLAGLAASDPSSWPTRDRILYEAAALMAARGYHGATTREIAEAVGIQQPSIFNHFASKSAILEELFEYDLVLPTARMQAIVREGGSPACQLYRYVEWQTRWYLEMPFDLRGVAEGLIAELGFEAPRRAIQQFRRLLRRIVEAGIEQGQFSDDRHDFLFPAINALGNEVLRLVHLDPNLGAHRRLADSGAAFVLRATLTDPSSLAVVQAEAASLARPDGLLR